MRFPLHSVSHPHALIHSFFTTTCLVVLLFTDDMIKQLDEFGVDWAGLDAAAEGLMRILSDRSVNGMRPLLLIR